MTLLATRTTEALESPLADLLSAAVAPDSPWDATEMKPLRLVISDG